MLLISTYDTKEKHDKDVSPFRISGCHLLLPL